MASKNKNMRTIERDIANLKDSATSVAQQLQARGRHKMAEWHDSMEDGLDTLKTRGMEGVEAIDDQIKENPRRSMLLAFVAGLAVNSLLRRAE